MGIAKSAFPFEAFLYSDPEGLPGEGEVESLRLTYVALFICYVSNILIAFRSLSILK
jgi:hypothetical protein